MVREVCKTIQDGSNPSVHLRLGVMVSTQDFGSWNIGSNPMAAASHSFKGILEDYKKLPQRTKKQKKYYKKAEQRARRLQIRRVDMLLDSLKTGKPVKQLA